MVVEQAKVGHERGHYLHPELYGATAEQSIFEARHPGMMLKPESVRTRLQQLQKITSTTTKKPQQVAELNT